jgi:phenylpropionate dioxygenase-like ring-hydroxylating dioxygenase large terminal subunit
MRREPHPLTGTIYEQIGDGLVKVQKQGSNSYGVFTWQGEWVEGDVTQADPNMLLYIGGPDLPPDHEVFWMAAGPGLYADASRPVDRAPGSHMSEMPRLVAPYSPDKGKMTDQGMRSAAHEQIEFFLENDRRPDLIPQAFRLESPVPGGPKKISTDRFYKPEFHDLEVERIWKRTWQMACREDDIPNVGDYHVYDIASLSYLVVRTAETEIKAHENVCLHRGRLLKDCSGKGAKEFMCPYHGWSWHIDGSLKEITTEWDFPGVRADVATLPPVKVATWGGFVFVNPDPDAGPLEDFLGPVMLDYYQKYKLQNRYKQAHVQKVVRANWKVVMEAFMESYHVIATHPHQMLLGGDLANTRYDVFGNFGRSGFLQAPGSPQRGIAVSREEALARYRGLADHQREFLRGLIGDEADQFSDAELTDGGTFNNLFPNVMPWGGFTRITFRYRPHGDNPDESLMEVLLLAPWPEGKPKPAPAKLRKLGPDEPWTAAPELLSLSKILDQDVANVPSVHAGLKFKRSRDIWYSSYQESKIRAWHELYEKALGLAG